MVKRCYPDSISQFYGIGNSTLPNRTKDDLREQISKIKRSDFGSYLKNRRNTQRVKPDEDIFQYPWDAGNVQGLENDEDVLELTYDQAYVPF